jgi:hypothetical protein
VKVLCSITYCFLDVFFSTQTTEVSGMKRQALDGVGESADAPSGAME